MLSISTLSIPLLDVYFTTHFRSNVSIEVQCNSELLSGFPWPIIFKPEITK
jgi:hypothetical protein